MKYIQTIKSIIVYPEGEAWFHELATEVCIEDDDDNCHVVLKQFPDDPVSGEVRLDPDELEAVYSAAKQLLNQHNNNGNNTTD